MAKPQGPFITSEESLQLAQQMKRKHASYLNERYFEVEFKRTGLGVFAKVTLRNKTGAFYYPVEGRVAARDFGLSDKEAALFLLDYIDAYYEEYLRENGEVYLPIDWADYECDEVRFQLKGQILNLVIEKMADDLLAGRQTEI